MVAPVPHGPTSPQHAVDHPGHADGEPLHAASEPRRPVRLHQQVKMIRLDAELEKAEGIAGGRSERAADGAEDGVVTKRWQAAPRAERDVHWTTRVVRSAPPVR